MADDRDDINHTKATTNQPLNAKPRPRLSGWSAVLGLLVVLAVAFIAITVTRYQT
jgi:hypothetical protein